MKYTLLALVALMSAPKGVASNAVLEDAMNQIANSTMNFDDMRDYALSMLFQSDQNEATESAINNILSSNQKDDLVKALKQYAGSKKNGVSEHQLNPILDSQKGSNKVGISRDQKGLLHGLLLELKRNRPGDENLFQDKKEFLQEVMNKFGDNAPDIGNLGFKDRWHLVDSVTDHYGLPLIHRGG